MPEVTRKVAAEAAVWIARLHGPDRTRAMELECLAWQALSAEHRLAFERCSDTWQDVAGLKLSTYAAAQARPSVNEKQNSKPVSRRMLVGAAMGCAAAAALPLWRNDGRYDTGIGEQRLVILADGTRMTLNTSTQVSVDLTPARRSVEVRRGEALFEVAKDTKRPFVVRTADASVTATGTAFVVRAVPKAQPGVDAFGVTLIEGQVVVQRSSGGDATAPGESVVMAPGERLRLQVQDSRPEAPVRMRLDRPRVDQLVAWQRGEAVFDATELGNAVADLNRYSRVQIVLAGQGLGELRISGVYRTGDSIGFADAVAKLYGLAVSRRGDEIRLSKPP
ncbi:FecR domain-containing protein [Roseateles sp.]|uniref:FecR family protein n=1 Tax=Roseateles sp. TaxID=1971397 RepID=UPI0025FA5DB9|nr:FecR domain-containing protein [Roseateles sp.]MBV8037416.1 FecR domain-containing protein [Roseateles sp.]